MAPSFVELQHHPERAMRQATITAPKFTSVRLSRRRGTDQLHERPSRVCTHLSDAPPHPEEVCYSIHDSKENLPGYTINVFTVVTLSLQQDL